MPEAITNLLRPGEVAERKEELSRIDEMLNSPPHVRTKISDPRAMAARRHRLREELDKFTPRAFSTEDKDAAVKRFNKLGEEIQHGMPSDEVMRRNPPGAVQQHQAWDRRNKLKVLERKHIGLRLQASGDLDDTLGEAAINVEMLRKRATGFDLPLDGAQIPKKTDYHIPPQPESVVFSDDQIKTLKDVDPKLASQLALLDADTRSKVKDILATFLTESAPTVTEAPKIEAKAKKPLPPGVQRMANLRQSCKANGINSWGMNTAKMVEALQAKGVPVEE